MWSCQRMIRNCTYNSRIVKKSLKNTQIVYFLNLPTHTQKKNLKFGDYIKKHWLGSLLNSVIRNATFTANVAGNSNISLYS